MNRRATSRERNPSDVPSHAYNGICSRLEDTGSVRIEGKEFLESPVSRARLQPTPPEYQERNSFVNRKREFRLTNSSAPSKRCQDGGFHTLGRGLLPAAVRNGSALVIAVPTHRDPSGEREPMVRRWRLEGEMDCLRVATIRPARARQELRRLALLFDHVFAARTANQSSHPARKSPAIRTPDLLDQCSIRSSQGTIGIDLGSLISGTHSEINWSRYDGLRPCFGKTIMATSAISNGNTVVVRHSRSQ